MTFVSYTQATFGVVDYIVFISFFCVSVGVGIFYSFSQKTTQEYFLGNRRMHPIPVGVSTGVSFLSAATLVGMPAEVYIHGYGYMIGTIIGSFGFFCGLLLVAHVMHSLDMTSLQQYFLRRYNSRVITFSANVFNLLCIFQYMGMCMVGSVIAFRSVTGGQVSVISGLFIGGVVGIFYTAIGGLKAVVWTDVIQSALMIMGTFTVLIKSIVDNPGGFGEVMKINRNYKHIHPLDWSLNPTIRHTMWGMTFGVFLDWKIWAVQAANVQRLSSTSNINSSMVIAAIASLLFTVFSLLPGMSGLGVFAFYTTRGCDIYAAGWIKQNEIILYYIRERLNWTGFQGLFMAALYAGSLSSLSSGLNAASAIMWNDLLKVYVFPDLPEDQSTLYSKLLVVTFGILSMIWCYVIYSIGGLLIQVCASLNSAVFGSYYALFILGVCCRWAQWKGALSGIIVGSVFTLFLVVGSLIKEDTQVTKLPFVIDRCNWSTAPFNRTTATLGLVTNSTQPPTGGFFSISYIWFSTICVTVTLITGVLCSLCTGVAKDVDSELILKPCRKVKRDTIDNEEERQDLNSQNDEPVRFCRMQKLKVRKILSSMHPSSLSTKLTRRKPENIVETK